jgi:hypothetical protein
MNMCANHPEKEAVAYCRMCGKPLCALCRLENFGAIYCAEHLPVTAGVPGNPGMPANPGLNVSAPPVYDPAFGTSPYVTSVTPSPYTAPVGHGSPALAIFLGAIPGVGAIYNGQYAKGLIHAVIFGLLVTIASQDGPVAPLVGILIAVWWFYMVLEAYHTARKRRLGIAVDEFSSLVNLHSHRVGFPIGAVVLIGAGMLLLLDSTGIIPLNRLIRYWPIGLILLGVYMLYSRMERRPSEVLTPQELGDERR